MSGDQIWGPPLGSIPQDLRRPEDDTTTPITFPPLQIRPGEVWRAVVARAPLEAKLLIGTREQGGNNRGALVEAMLRDEGGKPGDPWCLAFVQHVYGRCFARFNAKVNLPNGLHCGRFARACAARLPLAVTHVPAIGAIALRYPSGFDGPGHCGIVTGFDAVNCETIEGNTNAAGDRDSTTGDGVWDKARALSYWTSFVDISRLDP